VGLLLGALLATHVDVLFSRIFDFGWQTAFVAFAPTLFVLYRWFARRLPPVAQQARATTHTPLIASSHII
jgi:hypothetical protein